MTRKIDMIICKCGRVHFYSSELLDKLLNEEKELVLICSRCGDVIHIGANKELAICYDEAANPEEIIYNMYSYIEKNEEIDIERFNENDKSTIGKIIVDEGIGVYMKTGYYADYYDSVNGFSDYGSNFVRNKQYTELKELIYDMDEYEKNRSKVRMNTLINSLTEEQAEVLSCYLIAGLDWSGTKHKKF